MPGNSTYQRPDDFIDPGQPSKCTWKLNADNTETIVHTHREMQVII